MGPKREAVRFLRMTPKNSGAARIAAQDFVDCHGVRAVTELNRQVGTLIDERKIDEALELDRLRRDVAALQRRD